MEEREKIVIILLLRKNLLHIENKEVRQKGIRFTILLLNLLHRYEATKQLGTQRICSGEENF